MRTQKFASLYVWEKYGWGLPQIFRVFAKIPRVKKVEKHWNRVYVIKLITGVGTDFVGFAFFFY